MEANFSQQDRECYEIVKHQTQMLGDHDLSMAFHSNRVARTSYFVAHRLGLSSAQCRRVFLAANAHDVGKIAIPNEILKKADSLTEAEWSMMKQHSALGAGMLLQSPCLRGIAWIVWCHHERYDGTGYPNGLAGQQIPLESRIIALCDSFDAMKSDRAYRLCLPDLMCRREIERNIGRMYDPQVGEFALKNWRYLQKIQACLR